MSNDWQMQLLAQGAHVNHGAVVHFGDPQQEQLACATQTIVCDLSHLAWLEVSGADAPAFLQGQVTNDVKLLAPQHAHLTGYCSPKGRLLAIFLAYAHQGSIFLQLPNEIAPAIRTRLQMFVMRSQVQITAANQLSFGVSGPEASKLVGDLVARLPGQPFEKVTENALTLIQLPSQAHVRYTLAVPIEQAKAVWSHLSQRGHRVGKQAWDWLEIQAGMPEIVTSTQEQFVPQMANLDVLGGINFKKGCYTGQEIVARTHYLGSVKRRTYLAHIPSNTSRSIAVQAGDKCFGGDQQEVGQIMRVAPAPEGGVDVLVELRIEAQTSGKVYWQTQALAFKPLPYSLTTGD